jgi:hypothetical protein
MAVGHRIVIAIIVEFRRNGFSKMQPGPDVLKGEDFGPRKRCYFGSSMEPFLRQTAAFPIVYGTVIAETPYPWDTGRKLSDVRIGTLNNPVYGQYQCVSDGLEFDDVVRLQGG